MAVFLDTSALAKLYHQEKGTAVLEERLAAEPAAFVSRIGVVEMHSMLAGLVRTKEIDLAAMELLRRKFRSDARKDRFRVTTLGAKHYEKAEKLLVSHGSVGLRTLDSLQLAVALGGSKPPISAPVASCGVLEFLKAPNSYKIEYSGARIPVLQTTRIRYQ